jgi:DNA replicative helicase MCM subunit Mcm2 (Cdc46/Mcm family)
MKTNNLQNKRAVQATLTGQSAITVAANTEAQRFRRQLKPTTSIDFDPLFDNNDG